MKNAFENNLLKGLVCLSVMATTLLCPTAQAALGQGAASVTRDQQSLGGAVSSTPQGGYVVQQIAGPSCTVREYLAANGVVFAVTWDGTQMPDLKLLLGSYFDQYLSAAQSNRSGHHMLSMTTPELAISVMKMQRKSSGRAFVPALMPSGVTVGQLR